MQQKEKILKMLLILIGILILVAGLRYLIQMNSMTLSDYASQHPEQQVSVEESTSQTK